jgi:hypothetical protein
MLSDTRTPVLEVRLNAESAHPTLYTGIGPYDWAAVGRGQDGDGPYTDYVARLRGVELHHRHRPHRRPDPSRHRRRAVFQSLRSASMFNIFGKTDDLPSRHTGPAPSGRIENDGRCTSASPDLIALALEGFDLKGQIEALETRLKTVSDRLANSLGPGAVLVVDGVCRVPIASRQTFKLTDPETCKALLGGRFDDLVDSSTDYTLTEKFKAVVLDPDHPLSESLRACVAIKETRYLAFRPVRPD